ncbi:MAG: CNNM domain-containing protein [bacterium]
MELLAGFLLILITGFYAGSETALYRANWLRLTHWSRQHLAGSKDALIAFEKLTPTLITVLVGTNLSSVFAALLFENYLVRQFGAIFTPLAVALVVLLTLILGDYLPKALAQVQPSRWLRTSAFILNLSRYIFLPVVFILTRLLPKTQRFRLTREDYLKVIAQQEAKPQTANMAARLFRFSQMKVAEAAIPIDRVQSLPAGADRNEVINLLREYGYSRIPVYEKTRDNIIGCILAKDLLSGSNYPIRRVMRVKGSSRIFELLRLMQRCGEHLAVVEDQTGMVNSIVTLEDLVEELVGEIRSED